VCVLELIQLALDVTDMEYLPIKLIFVVYVMVTVLV